LPFLDLSEHDVRTVSLDWFEDSGKDYRPALERFRTLAAGVLLLRLSAWDQRAPDSSVASLTIDDILRKVSTRTLPRWTIDERLASHVNSADIPADHELFELAGGHDADLYLDAEFQTEFPSDRASASASSITYRGYLRSQGHGETHEISEAGRRQDNAEFRKRMVAAYLSICDRMRWEPIYCGWEEVLQLSDLCIRDFIWQFRELWRECDASSGSRFLDTAISPDAQSRALKAAASKKVAFSRKYLTVSPARTRRLVEGLAILTRELQASHLDPSVLASPERGIFVSKAAHGFGAEAEAFALVTDAARQGYLRLLSVNSASLSFRVHRCMAPLAGFSYRRPQYSIQLKPGDMLALSRCPDETSLRNLVTKLIQPEDSQMSLFD
jgi:hypothetical protein